MKKILVSLMVLALCVPAMAATVTVNDDTDGTGSIVVTASSDAIVGLGLDIAVSGANITAISIDPATFEIYPDAAQAAGAGYTYGAGSPIALIGSAGVDTLPSASFCISAGMLNGAATAGADGAVTVTIDVATDLTAGSSCTVTVTENALRGGIVLTTGANDAGSGSGTISSVSTVCYTGPDLAQWTLVGEPDSWCAASQCYGDADGATEVIAKKTRTVGYNDIDILVAGFNQIYVDPVTTPWIAADFDHAAEIIAKKSRRVGYDDIDVLLLYFNQAIVPADCNP